MRAHETGTAWSQGRLDVGYPLHQDKKSLTLLESLTT